MLRVPISLKCSFAEVTEGAKEVQSMDIVLWWEAEIICNRVQGREEELVFCL